MFLRLQRQNRISRCDFKSTLMFYHVWFVYVFTVSTHSLACSIQRVALQVFCPCTRRNTYEHLTSFSRCTSWCFTVIFGWCVCVSHLKGFFLLCFHCRKISLKLSFLTRNYFPNCIVARSRAHSVSDNVNIQVLLANTECKQNSFFYLCRDDL